ncbi:MAG: acetate--CoA ligase family protein, partial [Micrococcales bacterium]|nr:acetate--CoA ligase family protein [Micrococcales bacterium]
ELWASSPTVDVGEALDYLAGRRRLMDYGISYPKACAVRTPEQVPTAARGLRTPLVLKAGWLEHKTEVEGVKIGLDTLESARVAVAQMSSRLGEGEYVIEEMDTREGTIELIVGARRDDSFGPVVVVGLGGVHAEIYRDVALSLAPVTPAEARRMIESLRCLPLLQGFRGRPVVDIAAAADAVVAVSRLLAEQPDILECEINPLRVGPQGALAVDALVLAGAPKTTQPQDSQPKEVAR